ncbi:immunoglobulin domain protein [Trichuris suis]|nr:immunoglobulin domain protein [Trichuris suis]
MKDVTAQPGDNVSFTCHVKNLGRYLVAFVRTEPTMLISWQHKMFASKRNKYSLENNGEAWILWINNVDGSDEGIYMCQINTNPMVAQIASLTVQKPPKINKKSTTHDIIVKEGSNATLTCVADGSPKPIVSWRRKDNGIIITNEPEGYGESVIYKNNLVLYKLSRQHMGEYICLATNGIQPEESWSVKIQVHFAPKLLPSSNPIYASVGSKVELICTGEAWPRPTFSWSIDEKIILLETSKFEMGAPFVLEFRINSPVMDEFSSLKKLFGYIINSNVKIFLPDFLNVEYLQTTRSSSKNAYHSQGVLIINKLSPEDFGIYRCKAENEYGSESTEIELKEKQLQPFFEYPKVEETSETKTAMPSTAQPEVKLVRKSGKKSGHRNSAPSAATWNRSMCTLLIWALALLTVKNCCILL